MLLTTQYLPISQPPLIFLTVLLIILFAPIIMGRLRIPHIIGLVLAGVLIGPYGLHVLERDASFSLFGFVGLFYIMFLAGLEMDMEGLRRSRGRVLLFGVLTSTVRETFFFNQTRSLCSVTTSPVSDFLIDGKYTFEVGGKKKRQRQLQSIENGYVVKDDIEKGYGNIIPLWMFGMLY